MNAESTPLLTADLPGTAGAPQTAEDFRVDEIPTYLPDGKGEHCFALVRKRELTTPQAVERICQRFSLAKNAAGYAGLKDKHAITEQWISFAGADPASLRELQDDDLQVVQAERHGNKLRTGHLRGNRFAITLRDTCEGAEARARAIVERLAECGLPNYYGRQRFGIEGDNAEHGLQILRGERKPPQDKRLRRLLISAFQSQIFNDVLAERVRNQDLRRLLGGEVLQVASGGLFVSEDDVEDQRRLDAGEVTITGPICGPKMKRPLAGSPAAQREEAILTAAEVGPDTFAKFAKLARGARRALTVPIGDPKVEALSEGLRISFALPSGSYATVLMREITK